jgi:RecG-like helicase
MNVPNASVMIDEIAERFGLYTASSIAGRVGRVDESYCIPDDQPQIKF